MILADYIKKLQEAEEIHGDKECIFSGDPDGTHFYWLTEDPECVQMVSEELGDGLVVPLKEVNAILIN